MGSKSSLKYPQAESSEAVDLAGSGFLHLPPELLHLIVSQLGPADVARLSTVSRHLHDVLSAPVCWSTIDCTGPLSESKIKQIEVSLQRSREALLHVTLPSELAPDNLLPMFTEVAGRIVTLTVDVRYYRQQRQILECVASNVERLQLTAAVRYGGTNITITPREFSALKSLYIRKTITSPFNAPNLTRLVVDAPYGPELWSLVQMLGVLSQCASLEEFEVTHPPFQQSEMKYDPVHLPNLRTYIDSADEHYDVTLATQLSLPPTCSVTFNCAREIRIGRFPEPPIPPRDVTLKWTKLGISDPKYNYAGDPNVQRMIEGYNGRGWWFRSWENIAVNTGEYIPLERRPPIRYLTGIAKTAEVKTLRIGGKFFASLVHSAEEMLHRFPGLETLILSDPIVESYLEALSPGPQSVTPCPDLSHLVIHSLSPGRPIVFKLAEVAEKRKNANCPFKSVSSFTPELEEDLRNHLEEGLKLWIRGNIKLTVGDEARFEISRSRPTFLRGRVKFT